MGAVLTICALQFCPLIMQHSKQLASSYSLVIMGQTLSSVLCLPISAFICPAYSVQLENMSRLVFAFISYQHIITFCCLSSLLCELWLSVQV